MDDYAGRVLADRYRLPLPPSDGYELVETRAFDTYSGQEVLVRQVPLPEIVDAEVLDADGQPSASGRATGRAVRRSTDPAVRRAIEAAQAAAQVPDHPRLDQVFDVFAEAGSLWIVSELVAARPLAALLAERPLNPYRAAEIGSDVLTALRVLHAHGWTHRNITVRTVLVCDDGRVMLTGLAAGAAEEALCGYAPGPEPDADPVAGPTTYGIPAVEPAPPREPGGAWALPPARSEAEYAAVESYGSGEDDESYAAVEEYADVQEYTEDDGGEDREGREAEPFASDAGQEIVPRPAAPAVPYTAVPPPAEPGAASAAQLRAARAGAIAAYRAGARAAARVTEDRQQADRAPADLTKTPPEGRAPGAHGITGAEADADADTGVLPPQRPAPDAPVPPGRPPPGASPPRTPTTTRTTRTTTAPARRAAASISPGPGTTGPARGPSPRAAPARTRCAPTPGGPARRPRPPPSSSPVPPRPGTGGPPREPGRRPSRAATSPPSTGAPPPRSPPNAPARRGSPSSGPSPSAGPPSRRARSTRTGSSRPRSAPPPICGRSARCSTVPSRATPPTPRRTRPNSSRWCAGSRPPSRRSAARCGPSSSRCCARTPRSGRTSRS